MLEVLFKALVVKVHSMADISLGHRVTSMQRTFGPLLRSTKTLGVGTHRK